MQTASRPSRCMSRKFSIGKLASRSYFAARGASTRRPKARALSMTSACNGLRRNASGAKIGASCTSLSSGSCMASLFDQPVRIVGDERLDLRLDAAELGKNCLAFMAGHEHGFRLNDVGIVANKRGVLP